MSEYTVNYYVNYSISYLQNLGSFIHLKRRKQNHEMILYLYVWSKVKIKHGRSCRRSLRCTIIASASVVYDESMKTRKRKRKYWVRDYFRDRDQYGTYKLTLEELRLNDPFWFRRYLRMNTHVYEVHVSFFTIFLFKGTLCELMHRCF